ncbi:UTP23 small subunit processome component [Homo sapiens]|uniref:UTP23 small subunit processome component n=1 Tax=Homo sapiens TaxID=9606 RepID=E5RIC4_HUMAN|nr:UTP23 small subunit processome component [Homo sapiens]KAI4011765.1 UTP23 small subunit processome component [Homo sapiens]
MKITRQKHAKKHLGFFRNNFGVREPYQILLDGTFCQAALRGRIQLREQLPRYLMGETQLCTTSISQECTHSAPIMEDNSM